METSLPPPPPDAVPVAPAPTWRQSVQVWLVGAAPRPGQLTPGWRLAVAVTWVLALLGWLAAWKASRELGLATWWLGPSAAPRPFFIMLLPFVPIVAMLAAVVQNGRHLPWYGLLASAAGVAIAVGDLGRAERLGLVELAVAVATAAVSLASLSGRYRAAPS